MPSCSCLQSHACTLRMRVLRNRHLVCMCACPCLACVAQALCALAFVAQVFLGVLTDELLELAYSMGSRDLLLWAQSLSLQSDHSDKQWLWRSLQLCHSRAKTDISSVLKLPKPETYLSAEKPALIVQGRWVIDAGQVRSPHTRWKHTIPQHAAVAAIVSVCVYDPPAQALRSSVRCPHLLCL